jgi:rhamnogalacturonan endolyase
VKNDDFPLDRGTVTGQVKLTDGANTEGAWVVLSLPGDKDFNMSANGYEFWTKADADGKFTIPNIRPGQYTLFVSGADQFEDFVQENVSVVAKQTDDLGVLNWTPIKHGQRLWQIGVADHSSAEFKNGDDYRHFDNDARYIKSFPDDVTFTIGKSKENQDWNFSQWGWYAKRPYWSILFDEPKAQTGQATLTVGFTAFDYWPGLQVQINGQKVGKPIIFPKTGMAAYRVGRQDSPYHYATVTFDAALIKSGTNEMRLIMNNAGTYESMMEMMPNGVGAVMYDALRLEVDPAASGNPQGTTSGR